MKVWNSLVWTCALTFFTQIISTVHPILSTSKTVFGIKNKFLRQRLLCSHYRSRLSGRIADHVAVSQRRRTRVMGAQKMSSQKSAASASAEYCSKSLEHIYMEGERLLPKCVQHLCERERYRFLFDVYAHASFWVIIMITASQQFV